MPVDTLNDCSGCKIASLCGHKGDDAAACPKGWAGVLVFALPLLALIVLSLFLKS
jgi:hypothetical protein